MSLLTGWVAFWTVLYVVSSLTVILRLWLRFNNQRFGKSDLMAGFCLLLSTVVYAMAIITGVEGFKIYTGSYAETQKLSNKVILTSFVFTTIALLLIPLSKVCVTLLLLEVEVKESWQRVLKVVQALILVTAVFNVSFNIFGCYPAGNTTEQSIFWSILNMDTFERMPNQLQQRHCIVREQLIGINGGLNVLYEVVIFVCSISLVLRVRTTLVQKSGLGLFFTLGIFVMAATIRSTYLNLFIYLRQIRHQPVDISYFQKGGIWQAIEAYASLAVASVLPIRATLIRFFDCLLRKVILCETGSGNSVALRQGSQKLHQSKDTDEELKIEAQQTIVKIRQ